MHLGLIQPGVGKKPGQNYPKSWMMEPLALGVLAAATPDDVTVTLFDDRHETLPNNPTFEVVAIAVETYTARRAYALADHFRSQGSQVILGGIHATLCPDEAALHADTLVLGPVETLWPQVIADAQKRNLKPRYQGNLDAKFRGMSPRRDLFRGRPYLDLALVEASRGCPYACDFCAVAALHKQRHQYRLAEAVAHEMRTCGRRRVFLVDDNLTAQPAAAHLLLEVLAGVGIPWLTQFSIEAAGNEALVKALSKAGCKGVLIGFEALDASTLAAMNKGPTRHGVSYAEGLKRLADHGIPVYGTFVFGYDGVHRQQFERCLDFALETRLCMAAFNHLVPFPQTPLYRTLETQGRLPVPKWWLKPNGRFGEVVFTPKGMTAQELANTCHEFRQKFYTWSSILRRAWSKSNCGTVGRAATYFALNRFSGHAARARQDLPIGDGL